jgi:hypothetical protein
MCRRVGTTDLDISSIHPWPIQAVLWLEWGSSIAGRIPLRLGGPFKPSFGLEWGSSTAEHIPLRFAEQQMHMLRHDHIPINLKPETAPHALQGQLEDSPAASADREGHEF